MSLDVEPPSSLTTTVDRVLAVAHLAPAAHVAVIGHRTLPFVLALSAAAAALYAACGSGRPRPTASPPTFPRIVGLENERELDEALRAARWRTGARGRVVLEGGTCRRPGLLAAARERALATGLDVVSLDHTARRLLLAPAT